MGNVDVVRRVEEAYAGKDYDTIRQLISADVVTHTPGSEMLPAGVEGCIAANEGGHTYFPDRKTEVLDVFGQGDKVVAHVRMMGTNTGGLDWSGISPSDKCRHRLDPDLAPRCRGQDRGDVGPDGLAEDDGTARRDAGPEGMM